MRLRMLGRVLLVVGIIMVFSATSWAAQKIGYFEMAVVLQQSKWGKQANDEIKRQQESMKADFNAKAMAFKTAKEEFDKKKDVMDEKARTKKIQELQALQQEGEKAYMESTTKMNKLTSELRGPVVDKIVEIVKRLGRDDKYDFIFERETAGLVFTNEKEDLTKHVIEQLDKASPKR
jgi:outer membrane protein